MLIYAVMEIAAYFTGYWKRAPGGDDIIVKSYAMASPVLYAFCSVFLLRGANWARIPFFATCLASVLVVMIAQGSMSTVGSILFPILPALFLLSRDANRYFIGRDAIFQPRPEEEQRRQQDARRGGRYDY
jgi:hypothetical protein